MMELIICLIYIALRTASAVFTQADCPYQPVTAFMDGVCYWRHDDPLAFLDARKKCRQEGGDLAVMPNQQVINAVVPGSPDPGPLVNLYDVYPGGGEEGLPREYATTTVGGTAPFIDWNPVANEPSGYRPERPSGPMQDCAYIRVGYLKLHDGQCTLQQAYICSYDRNEPTHACITAQDCLSDHYQRLHHGYLVEQDVEHYGTVAVESTIECGVSCHQTPGCENIKWNPKTKQCQKLGHLTLVKHPYTDPDWQLFSRYRFYDYDD